LADNFSPHLGPLIAALGPQIDRSIISHYSAFLCSPNPNLQYFAAFSFPAVANSVGRSRFSSELLPSFERCCSASDVRVRRTIAFGLSSFASVVDRSFVTDAAFNLIRDIPEVSIGVISRLSELLPHVEDRNAFLLCFRNPSARFISWRMRLHVSEQIRKCSQFFNRQPLIDCASELIDDPVAAVRNDAAKSLGELLCEEDLWITDDLTESVSHWGRLYAAKILGFAHLKVALRAKRSIQKLLSDPVFAVRIEAEKVWNRIEEETERKA
jgi:hypothetical protein